MFARRGYDRASVSEIADEAGYSHGAVYSNFAGKEDLFLALYADWVQQRVAEIDADTSGSASAAEGARAGVDEWLSLVDVDPDAFLLRLEFTTRAARDPELRRKLGERVAAVPLALARSIERAAKADGNRFALSAREVGLGVQALSLGLALEALANPDALAPGVGGELAARFVSALTLEQEPR